MLEPAYAKSYENKAQAYRDVLEKINKDDIELVINLVATVEEHEQAIFIHELNSLIEKIKAAT